MTSGARDIAIVGYSCRFPGGAGSPDAYWGLLRRGGDAIAPIPDDRWDPRLFHHPDPAQAGRYHAHRAGTLGDVSGFDPTFFGISPREAEQMDPQQRLLLELTWEALERGGQVPSHIAGSDCAVYVGISSTDYGDIRQGDPAGGDAYFMLGSTLSIAANRISYLFDLHGPSMAIDTACSSALVALHEAVQAIRRGQAPMAVVGSMHLLLSPYPFIGFSRASMLSPAGECRPFDKDGKGYVRAEGGGVVVLKPLKDAERDGDPIHAVIRGVGINADGRTPGIAMPSSQRQEELLRRTYRAARVNPRDLAYFEAHGTGTAVGDPAEAGSVGRALARRRPRRAPLPIGSVKGNLGHLEPAAGMAGLIKALLVLRHREIPPSLRCDELNPDIPFTDLNLRVVRKAEPLPRGERPALVGVNAFGFGGANAHVILQEYRPPVRRDAPPTQDEAPPLFLSARTDEALRAAARRMAGYLDGAEADAWYDIAYTAACRREQHEHRLVAPAAPLPDLAEQLRRFAEGEETPQGFVTGITVARPAPVAMLFSGNGGQWAGMGAALLGQDAAFRAVVEQIDSLVRAEEGWSVIAEMNAAPEDSRIDDTRIAQPLIFALQAGLVAALRARGVVFAAVAGHSVGEVSAAHAAGILDLEQAVHVILKRSAAQALTRGQGRMAALDLDAERAAAVIAPYDGRIEIAAINSPRAVTLSGDEDALHDLGKTLEGEGASLRMLDLDYAFHNRVLDPVRPVLAERLGRLDPAAGEVPFYSTVTGGRLGGTALDADYWWDNVRRPVRFHDAIAAMAADGLRVFLEVGPHPIVQSYVRHTLRALDVPGQPLFVINRQNDGAERLGRAVAQVHTLGGELDRARLFPRPGRVVELPTYPFQRERYWFRRTPEARALHFQRGEGPLLGTRPLAEQPLWEVQVDTALFPFLADHVVGGSVVFPAAGFIEMALEASRRLFGQHGADVENLEIRRPLALEAGRAKILRFSWHPADAIFRIESRTRLQAEDWTLHATGRLAAPTGAPPVALAPLPDAQARFDADGHYAFAARLGLEYGPMFRAVRAARVAGEAAEVELAAPEGLDEPDGMVLHPSLLDGGLQGLFALLRAQGGEDADPPVFLPYQLGRMRYHGGGPVARCRVGLDAMGPRSVTASFVFTDADGAVVAEARGFRFQQVELGRGRAEANAYHRFQVVPLHPLNHADVAPLPSPGEVASWLAGEAKTVSEPPNLTPLAAAFAAEALAALDPEEAGSEGRAPLIERLQGLAETADRDTPAEVQWRRMLARHPEALAELLMLGRAGLHLPAWLRGGDRAAWTPGAALAEHFRTASPTFAPAGEAMARLLGRLCREAGPHRRLRVLEIGAASAAGTRRLLAALPQGRVDVVVGAADADAAARLEAELAGLPDVAVRRLDLLAPVDDQEGIAAGGYDIVLGTGVVADAPVAALALEAVRGLLAPGGLALLAEARPLPWLDLVFGHEDRWWQDGPDGPRGRLMHAVAFAAAAGGAGLDEARAEEIGGAVLLVARRRAAARPIPATVPGAAAETWLLLAGATGGEARLAEDLRRHLEEGGHTVLRVRPGEGYDVTEGGIVLDPAEAEDWRRLWADLHGIGAAPGRVVHLLGLDGGGEDSAAALAAQEHRCWPVVALAQSLADAPVPAPQLTLVTAGAVAVPDAMLGADGAPVPEQAPLWGLGRVLRNEQPDLRCRLLDLRPADGDPASLAEALALELTQGEGEDEVVLAPGRRLGLRLRPVAPPTAAGAAPDEATTRLTFRPGVLERLHWAPAPRRAPGPGEVEIAIRATGLNFRDVMFALGALPDEAVEDGFAGAALGMEAAGVVTRVGREVAGLAPGDEVLCFASQCFSGHITTTATAVARKPAGLSFAAAATIPTVFFTVYYALGHLARLEPGERVLIHGAAGGVGLAAIQYARHVGAEVFATAGSEEKRDMVRLCGVPADHVLDSRSLAFADEVMTLTGGEGVDVVLNALAGEAIHKSLSLLRPFGRFLELGKRDFYENSRIGLRPFRNNISYFGIDADQLMARKPALAARLFRETMGLFERGVFTPLPYRAFPRHEIVDAFRHMQQSRHIGKIVVTAGAEEVAQVEPARPGQRGAPGLSLDPSAAYLVTGGLSGFGLATARWLAEKGARTLVLLGRGGVQSEEARAAVTALESQGVRVLARACDVTDEARLRAVVAEAAATAPLKGVVHAAAVFDDATAAGMSREQFLRVLAPKTAGAWALHAATLDQPLDFFVLYSSITTAFGNPGQGNYVAANQYLEALAEFRRGQGLPALAVCWGPIADAGYLARHAELREALEGRLNAGAITTREAFAALEGLLLAGAAPTAVGALDWRRLRGALPGLRASVYAGLAPAAETGGETGADFRTMIAGMSPEDVRALLVETLAAQVAQILRIPPERVDPHKPIVEMGMDSLMGMELRLMVEDKCGVELPAMAISDNASIARLAETVASHLLGHESEGGGEAEVATLLARHDQAMDEADMRDVLKEVERAREQARLIS